MRNTLAWALDIVCWLTVLAILARWLRLHARAADAWPALTAGRLAVVLALGQLLLTVELWAGTPRGSADAAFRPDSPLALLGTAATWIAAVVASLLTLAITRATLRFARRWPTPLRKASGIAAAWLASTVLLVVGLGCVLAAHLALASRDYGKTVPVLIDDEPRLRFVHAPEAPALDYGLAMANPWHSVHAATEALLLAPAPNAQIAAAQLSAQTPLLRLRPARAEDALLDPCSALAAGACAGQRFVAEIGTPWPYIAQTPLTFLHECIRTMRGTLLGLPRSLLRRDLDNAGRFFALDAEAAAHYVDRAADVTVQTLVHRANPRHPHALNVFPALLAALWLPALLTLSLLFGTADADAAGPTRVATAARR